MQEKQKFEKIRYGYKIIGNQLILDNYLITDFKNKYRDQEVEIFLYLPEGTLLKPDNSVQDYDNSDDSFSIYILALMTTSIKLEILKLNA